MRHIQQKNGFCVGKREKRRFKRISHTFGALRKLDTSLEKEKGSLEPRRRG